MFHMIVLKRLFPSHPRHYATKFCLSSTSVKDKKELPPELQTSLHFISRNNRNFHLCYNWMSTVHVSGMLRCVDCVLGRVLGNMLMVIECAGCVVGGDRVFCWW